MDPVSLPNHMSKYTEHLDDSSTLAFVNNVVMDMGIQILLPGTNFLSCPEVNFLNHLTVLFYFCQDPPNQQFSTCG